MRFRSLLSALALIVLTLWSLAAQGPGAPTSVTVTARPATPLITLLSPSSGLVGSSVTISGSGFAATQGSGTVKFNGVAASITSWSALSIVVTVPATATTGLVIVNQNGLASGGVTYTVTSASSNFTLPASRAITWAGKTGLDPVGGIPSSSWTTVACSVVADGVTNQVSQINACISAAAANRVVTLPCGPILASGTINMKSSVALRGCAPLRYPTTVLPTADAAVTTLVINGNQVLFNGGSKGANWTPYGANSGIAVSSGYTKDSTQLTVASTTGLAVNGWISLYQNEDTSLMSWKGINYLGEDCACATPHAWQQYTKITAINGLVLTIDPPVYQTSASPTGVAVRPQSFGVQMAGLEDVRLQGNNTGTLVRFAFTAYIWLKDIESYGGGDNSGENHILGTFSINAEIRDSIVHDGGSFNSGANYGIGSYWWNSAYKIENNEIYHTRHSIIFEAGMSGAYIGYNYSHDNAEGEDFTFLSQDCTPNHGANPMMNLWEGNYCQQFYSDWTQGSASYNTLFRNYASGTRTFHPASGLPFRIGPFSRDYNLVGNVSGRTSWVGGTAICNSGSCSGNIGYEFGVHTDGSYQDSQARSTALLQGNYEYVTDGAGTVYDDANHSLPASLYYASKPAFLGTCAFPWAGPDVTNQFSTLPALERSNGTNACGTNGTITSVNCSNAATVNTALTAAASGDTISCTTSGWASGTVNMPTGKNVTLQGNGLTFSGGLNLSSSASTHVRVTNFICAATSRYAVTSDNGYQNSPWRFDHITLTTGTVAILGLGSSPGLIDHMTANNIAGIQQTIEPVFEGASSTFGWTTAHAPGSPNAVYIEDSSFKHPGIIWDAGNVTQGQYGARVVYRHNTIDAVQIEFHGGPGSIGGRWWEIYNNSFVNGGSVCLRAGSGMAFNNTGAMTYFVMLEEDSGYPALYQIGRGQNQVLTPAYAWSNPQQPDINAGGNCSAAAANMVQFNRDVYSDNGTCVAGGACTSGVGQGTTLPTTCTTGTGFWKTDAGGNWDTSTVAANDGALYTCTTPNVWGVNYTPYAYPHPLQSQ